MPLPIAIGILKHSGSAKASERLFEWMFGRKVQLELVKRFLYSPIPTLPPPAGAPTYAKMRETAFKWTPVLLEMPLDRRVALRERFAEIMFE